MGRRRCPAPSSTGLGAEVLRTLTMASTAKSGTRTPDKERPSRAISPAGTAISHNRPDSVWPRLSLHAHTVRVILGLWSCQARIRGEQVRAGTNSSAASWQGARRALVNGWGQPRGRQPASASPLACHGRGGGPDVTHLPQGVQAGVGALQPAQDTVSATALAASLGGWTNPQRDELPRQCAFLPGSGLSWRER